MCLPKIAPSQDLICFKLNKLKKIVLVWVENSSEFLHSPANKNGIENYIGTRITERLSSTIPGLVDVNVRINRVKNKLMKTVIYLNKGRIKKRRTLKPK